MLPANTNGPRDWAKEEDRLYDLLIQYRKDLKLSNPEVPRSPSLNMVAQTHANNPFFETPDSTCNAHSWPAKKEAKFKSCCFDLSNSEAHPCMWDKPRELTTYQGNGFEVYYGGDPEVYTSEDTAEECLKALQKSVPHNDVLINNGTWTTKWEAVGVGMAKGQCAIWFGHEKDIATLPDSQTAQDGLETPGAQEQQVGHEKPNNPDPNPNPTPTPTPDADLTPDNDSRVAAIWTQCGGKTWTGPTACAEGLVCKKFGEWYSQCKPAA
ncbi:S-layer domain-containing protein [Beauveria brongniartii RCEF 3172]|uniref:S-layer domain-containing protein n=1 Tax=Beauveria brongniartii RCEF 3172 TaxID=1081107 RepID=A0A166ZC32_9HYPO|nr:S-layer domain-containing protein [Beauveria brongniartii RCEF 3172]